MTGIDSVSNSKRERQWMVVKAHIDLVRTLPGLTSSKVIFCPETNWGQEGERLVDDLERAGVHEVYSMHEHGRGHALGFWTSNRTKKAMWSGMRALLEQRSVSFHPMMICANTAQQHTPGSMRAMLIKELRDFKRVTYPSNDPYKPHKEVFTGKITGSNDDHAIVVQLLVICHKIYWERYDEFYSKLRPIRSREQASNVDSIASTLRSMSMANNHFMALVQQMREQGANDSSALQRQTDEARI